MTLKPDVVPLPEEGRHTPPWLFGILVLPFSAAIGWAASVPFFLRAQGVSLATIGVLSATAAMPHGIKFLWSPLIDFGRWRKVWYLGASVACAILLGMVPLIPNPAHNLGLLTVVLTASQVAAATLASALDALMATTTHVSKQGRASGAYAAGNTGGTSVFSAMGVWLVSHVSPQLAGITIAAAVLLCCIWVFVIVEVREKAEEKPRHGVWTTLGKHFSALGKDLWATVKSRYAITGLIVCALPVGTGALTNIFTGMASAFHASDHVVELSNVLGGGVSFLGALVGGPLADRMNRRVAYALAGGLTACAALAMFLAPMTATTYLWGTLCYQFANAIAYTAFYALVLEIVSHGAAVTTKYTLFVAVSNLAINYVTALDGFAPGLGFMDHTKAVVLFDVLITCVGIALFGLMVFIDRRQAEPEKATVAV